MAIAGTLAVNILANTNKFQQGIGKAQKSLRGFGRQIKTIGKGVVGFGSQILGVAAVGGITAFSKSVIDSAVSLGEISDKLGIATDKLELMRFAAEATGVAQKSLDTALQRMVRRVGEASQGFGAAEKTLKRLNLNAKELNELSPDEMFTRIGDAINQIPDRGGSLAAMSSIFDMEGVGLINLTADGLERYADAFERAGGPTSRQGVKNAREFAFHAQTLKGAFAGLGRDFVLEVSPDALKAIEGAQILLEATKEGRRKAEAARSRRVQRAGGIGFNQFSIQERVGGFAIGLAELAGNPRDILGRDRSPVERSMVRARELESRRQSVLTGQGDPGRSVSFDELSGRMDSLKKAIERQTKDLISAQKTTSY